MHKMHQNNGVYLKLNFCNVKVFTVFTINTKMLILVSGKLSFKSNALQYCVTP